MAGYFDANMENIQFDADGVQRLQGNINFSALDINGVLRLSMGDVSSVFEPMTDRTQIDINNNDGHIDLAGEIQLYNDMKYQLDMVASKNINSTEAVINGLNYVGEQQADGSIRLQQSGSL